MQEYVGHNFRSKMSNMFLALFILSFSSFNSAFDSDQFYTNRLFTPNRSEDIRAFFTHFVPFEDMQNAEAREQFYGLTRIDSIFPSPDNFEYFPDKFINLTHLIVLYADAVALAAKSQPTPTLNEIFTNTLMARKSQELTGEPLAEADEIERFRKYFFDKPVISFYEANDDFHFLQLMHAWRAFFYVIINSSKKWMINLSEQQHMGFHTHIIDKWSLLFIKLVCEISLARSSHQIKFKIPNGFCPNACRLGPCLDAANTDGGVCTSTGLGRFDYTCQCLPGFQWKTFKNRPGVCRREASCKSHCDKKGTRACNDETGKPLCTCRSSHMGPMCKEERDPCVERYEQGGMPGDMACNVAQGGKCLAITGTDSYNCKCPPGFTSNTIYYFPNCLALQDRCVSTICVQGDCISSPNGRNVYCLCPEDAYGPRCEYTRGKWAQWTPWSTCSPICGLYKLRRRYRTRDCLGRECGKKGGGHLEIDFCPDQPCPDEVMASLESSRMQSGSMSLQLLEGRSWYYVKLLGATAEVLVLFFCLFASSAVALMFVRVQFGQRPRDL